MPSTWWREELSLMSKLKFLALKWAITEQFCEYLQYQSFYRSGLTIICLLYILTTPNLDAIGHRWVATLASFDMSIEYLRGVDNKVADALSRKTWLEKEVVDEILEQAKNSMAPRAEANDPRLVQQVEIMEEDFVIQVHEIADEEPAMKKLQQADWPMLQCYDPVIRHMLDWASLPPAGWVHSGRLHGRKGPRRSEETLHTPSEGFRHSTTDVVPQNYTLQHSRGGTCLHCALHKTEGPP